MVRRGGAQAALLILRIQEDCTEQEDTKPQKGLEEQVYSYLR